MAQAKPAGLKARLAALYDGETPASHRFRYGLLVFDVVTIAFVVAFVGLMDFQPNRFFILVVMRLIISSIIRRHRLFHIHLGFKCMNITIEVFDCRL